MSLDRRSFMALGLGALAWACSRGGDGDDQAEPTASGAISVAVTGQTLSTADTRQAFAVFQGQRPITPDGVRIQLVPPDEGEPVEVDVEPVEVGRGLGGESSTEVTQIYVVRHDFSTPGVWTGRLAYDGGAGEAAFQTVDGLPGPTPGEDAIASDSATLDDPGEVDPVCTRDPVCSMHDMTIAQALDDSRPTVVIFGTPQFCTSRTCGPVVDAVEDAKADLGDDVNFIHIEVWRNDEDAVNDPPDGFTPTFAEWKLQTEPWTYFIDADGVVQERFLGAAGSGEIAEAARSLL